MPEQIPLLSEDYMRQLNNVTYDIAANIILNGIDTLGPDFFPNWINRCEWLECDERRQSGNRQCQCGRTADLIDVLYNFSVAIAFCCRNRLENITQILSSVIEQTFDFVGAKISYGINTRGKRQVLLSTAPEHCMFFAHQIED